ncbi:MAG: ATP-dependent Clp protease adaptor ClpS [Phycisphaerales bacterium]
MPEHQDSTSNESTQPRSPDTESPKPPVATQTPTPTRQPNKPKTGKLPPWKVVLHNDHVNGMEDVVTTIKMLTPLTEQAAVRRMLEAHTRGRSMLLTTHRERAELYKDQFASRGLTVTIGPA